MGMKKVEDYQSCCTEQDKGYTLLILDINIPIQKPRNCNARENTVWQIWLLFSPSHPTALHTSPLHPNIVIVCKGEIHSYNTLPAQALNRRSLHATLQLDHANLSASVCQKENHSKGENHAAEMVNQSSTILEKVTLKGKKTVVVGRTGHGRKPKQKQSKAGRFS